MKQVPVADGYVAVVDDEDYDLVSGYRWRMQRGGRNRYAATSVGGRTVLMHRLILTAAVGTMIDHVSGDGLDNRKANLRACTHAENFRNGRWRATPGRTSRYKGVWRIKGRCLRCWRAGITADRVYKNIGSYWTEEEAARAYDEAAKRLHREFARLNFPEPRPADGQVVPSPEVTPEAPPEPHGRAEPGADGTESS